MKFCAFDWRGGRHIGRVLERGEGIERFDVTLEGDDGDGVLHLLHGELPPVVDTLNTADVRLVAPIPRPRRNVFCVGKNYHDHAHEFAASGFDSSAAKGAIPEAPIVFSKVPESVIGPDEPVVIDPAVSTAVDYEVELGVIIGKRGRNIAIDAAASYVWGYTIINDVTARDLQGLHSQWLIGKSQDTFCPMGPWAVTAEDVNLSDCKVRCWINDELRQDSNTSLLIFDVPTIIAAISNGVTLQPGDVIATGTPAGVGIGFDPAKYLVAGDQMKLEIDGIGVLQNTLKQA